MWLKCVYSHYNWKRVHSIYILLQPYSEVLGNEDDESKQAFVTNRCLISLYIPLLLNTGFGFANDSQHIFVRSKITGQKPGTARAM